VSYVLRLTAAAQDDIGEIAYYLDGQDPRIGNSGLIAIEKTLSRIERTPLLYPRLHRGARCAVVPMFHLLVWYWILERELIAAGPRRIEIGLHRKTKVLGISLAGQWHGPAQRGAVSRTRDPSAIPDTKPPPRA